LVLESDLPDVPLVVKRQGQPVRGVSARAGRPVLLPAGAGYTVELAAGVPGVGVTPVSFTLPAGGTQRVEVRRRPEFAGEVGRLEAPKPGYSISTLFLSPR